MLDVKSFSLLRLKFWYYYYFYGYFCTFNAPLGQMPYYASNFYIFMHWNIKNFDYLMSLRPPTVKKKNVCTPILVQATLGSTVLISNLWVVWSIYVFVNIFKRLQTTMIKTFLTIMTITIITIMTIIKNKKQKHHKTKTISITTKIIIIIKTIPTKTHI